jgi:hypothetical protein
MILFAAGCRGIWGLLAASVVQSPGTTGLNPFPDIFIQGL